MEVSTEVAQRIEAGPVDGMSGAAQCRATPSRALVVRATRALVPVARTGAGPVVAGALARLMDAAHELPGLGEVELPSAFRGTRSAVRTALAGAALGAEQDPDARAEGHEELSRGLHARLAALLVSLAERTEPALQRALERAASAWDQFDEVSILDGRLRAEASALGRLAGTLAGSGDPAARALGLEAGLCLEAALGLVSLLERRLATLVRLRLRAEDPRLFVDGRPFLDVAAALEEAARAWA